MEINFAPPDPQADLPGTPLQQSSAYAAVLAAFGCETAVADIRGGGALLGRARIHLRRLGPLRLAWLPRGPVWTDHATPQDKRRALSALPRAAPWRALWAISQDAGEPRRGLPVARGCRMAELDLRLDAAARRAAQHGKWRNRLARAEAAGLTVTARPLNLPHDAALLARETAQRRTRGYAALPPAFTEKWAALGPDASLMLTVHAGGPPIAFMVFLLHARTATYHLGWSGDAGRAQNAHNLALWRAGLILATKGYTRLDLGHIDAERAPGLARFKLGTGAAPRDLGATTLRLNATLPLAISARSL